MGISLRKKEHRREAKEMLKKGLIVFSLAIAVIILVTVIRNTWRDIRNKKYKAGYPLEIERYLEKKYGKKFIINPEGELLYSGSPIPAADVYSPYLYEVREPERDGSVFNVWVYPRSSKDKKIEKFRDNYCWKFLSIMTKEWFQEEMADILPEEYKLIFVDPIISEKNESITPNSPLAYYFETRETTDYLYLYLILPPGSSYEEDGLTEENVIQVIREFYQKYPKVRIRFLLEQTKDMESYKKISIREEENLQFYLYKSRDENPFLDMELKMDIELELED